jgi:NhaA family Na+:H+ antiporter
VKLRLRGGRTRSLFGRRLVQPIQAFITTEAAGGAFVVAAAIAAFTWANSPWDGSYRDLWESRVTFETGLFSIDEDLRHVVNDGLMALFFFLIGLETKREFLRGELADRRKAALPVAGAVGGMVVPALIYTGLNAGGEGAKGWGIPMATDIAFALGVLALVGSRVPFALKVFLLALAVVDDVGAIVVIAAFYSDSLSWEASVTALGLLALIVALGVAGVRALAVYAVCGVVFWLAVFESGVHATIAGVILALLTPARAELSPAQLEDEARGLLERSRETVDEEIDTEQTTVASLADAVRRAEAPLDLLERWLHPWVVFLIVPVFALANAGVRLSSSAVDDAVTSAVTGGIVLGLVVGKPAGILLFAWLAVRTKLAALPEGVRWLQLASVGVLGGVGFTVSLFITDLAFDEPALTQDGKIGILAASLMAAALGLVALWLTSRPEPDGDPG